MSISEKEIRETIYNTMLDIALAKNIKDEINDKKTQDVTIKYLVCQTIRTLCSRATENGFPTIRGNLITNDNVHPDFADLFKGLTLLTTAPTESIFNIQLGNFLKAIEQKGTFQQMITKLITFYVESQKDNKEQYEINEEKVRATFYNIMVNEVIDDQMIEKDHLKDRDPYIYIALSSMAIISSIVQSRKTNGILLLGGSFVDEKTCPDTFKPLCKHLLILKAKFLQMKLNDDQILLIRLYSTTNPDVVIPEQLEKQYKNPQLMDLVSLITSLAIQISSIAHFKSIIDDVITYCIDVKPDNK